MVSDELRAQTQRTAQPVQQAQAQVEGGAFNPIAAIRLSGDCQTMVTLNLLSGLNDILPGGWNIDIIYHANVFRRDGVPWEIQH